MDYIERWASNLLTRSPYNPIKQNTEAWGEYNKHTGPAIRYAKVMISIEPSESFRVIDRLDTTKSARLRQEGCLDQIVFGVLDLMLTSLSTPINSFTLILRDVDYDETTLSPLAFRLAARDATKRILNVIKD